MKNEDERPEPGQASNSVRADSLEDPIPIQVTPDHDIGPNRVRIALPIHMHPGRPQFKSVRLAWIIERLFRLAKEDVRWYRKHYIVNAGTLLIVEFWPPPKDSMEQGHSAPEENPNVSMTGVLLGVPNEQAGLTFPPTITPPQLDNDATRNLRSSPNIGCSIQALGSTTRITDQTEIISSSPGATHDAPDTHHPPQSAQAAAHPTLLHPMQCESYDRHPSLLHRKPRTATVKDERRDIANNTRYVRPTNHQQIILPSLVQPWEESMDFGCAIPPLIISDRYVASWVPGNSPEFVPRLPPR